MRDFITYYQVYSSEGLRETGSLVFKSQSPINENFFNSLEVSILKGLNYSTSKSNLSKYRVVIISFFELET